MGGGGSASTCAPENTVGAHPGQVLRTHTFLHPLLILDNPNNRPCCTIDFVKWNQTLIYVKGFFGDKSAIMLGKRTNFTRKRFLKVSTSILSCLLVG